MFNRSFLLLTLLAVYPLHSFAQNAFERTYGGPLYEQGNDVIQTTDGGYIVTGYASSQSFTDMYVVKTDALGDTLWTRMFGGSHSEAGYSVRQTSDGGYISAGYTGSMGSEGYNAYLAKISSFGNLLWERAYGGDYDDYARSVLQLSDGGYVFTGYTNSSGAGGYDVYLVKTDASGYFLWDNTFGGTEDDYGYSVQQTSDGGFIIVGKTKSFPWTVDYDNVYLVKTDSTGTFEWQRIYGGAYPDVGYCVRELSAGGYIIAGYTYINDTDPSDVYVIKTGESGNVIWEKAYHRELSDRGFSVVETSDGDYAVAGYTGWQIPTRGDIWLINIDAEGDTLWTRTYGGGEGEEAYAVGQTTDGGFIITGYTESFGAGNKDVYLVKVDTHGPAARNAVASDNINSVPGIDDDDQVVIAFDEPTDKPVIDALNIEDVLRLSGGHTWTDGFGNIGSAVWNAGGDMLLITLSTTLGAPTIAVGDTITPDGTTIRDEWGNPSGDPVVLTGSFDEPSGIGDEGEGIPLPRALKLSQNYPNPFNPSTTIRFELPGSAGAKYQVTLAVYDTRGRLIRTLVDAELEPGRHTALWNGRNEMGMQVPSGIYLYALKTADAVYARKMTILK